LIGRGKKIDKIFLIDFGLSKKYIKDGIKLIIFRKTYSLQRWKIINRNSKIRLN